MKKIKTLFLSTVFCWCVMCLCLRCYMNLAGFQTGRTLGQDGVELTVSYNRTLNSPTLFDFFEDQIPDLEYSDEGVLDIDMKYGIATRLDVGVNLGLLSGYGANAKYQVYGDRISFFAASIGAGIGDRSGGLYWHLPVYLSIHPTKHLSIYMTPRYIYQKINEYYYDTDLFHFKGFNTGFLYGCGNFHLGLDYGYFFVTGGKKGFPSHSFGLGFKILLPRD